MHIESGNVYKFEFGKTKDGTVIMEDVINVWRSSRTTTWNSSK
jgi:phosphoribosylaminoimidazole-succinocarboxamide synthase